MQDLESILMGLFSKLLLGIGVFTLDAGLIMANIFRIFTHSGRVCAGDYLLDRQVMEEAARQTQG